MSLSEQEPLQIARVVSHVLERELAKLRTELAEMVVEIMTSTMEDLSTIFQQRQTTMLHVWHQQEEAWKHRVKAGFST